MSIKDLKILADFRFNIANSSSTQISVCATNFRLFREISTFFSVQLSSQTQFAKIENKKVIAENQCEKHKKSSLVCFINSV